MLGSNEKSWLDATPSKTAFAFGLVLGVGAAALLGFVLLLSLFLSGKMPTAAAAAAAKPSAQVADPSQPSEPTGPVDITLDKTDHVPAPTTPR
jgi:hypothetical protein